MLVREGKEESDNDDSEEGTDYKEEESEQAENERDPRWHRAFEKTFEKTSPEVWEHCENPALPTVYSLRDSPWWLLNDSLKGTYQCLYMCPQAKYANINRITSLPSNACKEMNRFTLFFFQGNMF